MSKVLINSDGVVIKSLFGCNFYKPQPKKEPTRNKMCLGSPTMKRAKLSFAPDGSKISEPGESLDLDAMIQSALPTTDIAAIVARVKAGDDSVLHVNPGFVGDAVSLPKDLYDYKAMNNLYDKVSASFNNLPDEVKALFNNSAEDYLNSIIANKADAILAEYKAKQEAPAASGGDENA